jgi:hypothetical protein
MDLEILESTRAREKSVIRDPRGNHITVLEIAASSREAL